MFMNEITKMITIIQKFNMASLKIGKTRHQHGAKMDLQTETVLAIAWRDTAILETLENNGFCDEICE